MNITNCFKAPFSIADHHCIPGINELYMCMQDKQTGQIGSTSQSSQKTQEVQNKSTISAKPQKKSKKTLIIVLASFFLLSLCVCGLVLGGVFYLSYKEVEGLKRVENDTYIFYYPENYGDVTELQGELTSESQETNLNGGKNSIRTVKPSSLKGMAFWPKECETIADEIKNDLEALPTVQVELTVVFTEFSGGHGESECTFGLSMPLEQGTGYYEAKYISEAPDTKAAVTMFYDSETSDEEVDRLKRSLKQFKLKE